MLLTNLLPQLSDISTARLALERSRDLPAARVQTVRRTSFLPRRPLGSSKAVRCVLGSSLRRAFLMHRPPGR